MPNTPILSLTDIIKDAQRIHAFRGDGSYALTSFLREVNMIFAMLTDNLEATAYVFNKLQGDALHVLRTLGDSPSWREVQAGLVKNFGVKESYYDLYGQIFQLRTADADIRTYFGDLLDVLCKMNEKYEYDTENRFKNISK